MNKKKYKRKLIFILVITSVSINFALGQGKTERKNKLSPQGYVLVLPEKYVSRNHTCFSLGYCDKEKPVFKMIGSWDLYDSFGGYFPGWLEINRITGKIIFSVNNYRDKNSNLYICRIGERVIWSKYKVSVSSIGGGWDLNSNSLILHVIGNEKNAKPRFMLYNTSSKSMKLADLTQSFMFPAYGCFSSMLSSGGPHFLWSPKSLNLHLWVLRQKLKLPVLPCKPPKELYIDRRNSKWFFRGDLKKSFMLYTNPYYYEAQKGLTARVGIFLHSQKKWIILNLPGTECHPVYFGRWFVIDIGKMDPKSRPEKFLHCGFISTGNYIFVDLETGKTCTLKLSNNSSILYVNKSVAVVREKNIIYEIPISSIGANGKEPEKVKLCEGDSVQYVDYAFPVAKFPEVEVPAYFCQ